MDRIEITNKINHYIYSVKNGVYDFYVNYIKVYLNR